MQCILLAWFLMCHLVFSSKNYAYSQFLLFNFLSVKKVYMFFVPDP